MKKNQNQHPLMQYLKWFESLNEEQKKSEVKKLDQQEERKTK